MLYIFTPEYCRSFKYATKLRTNLESSRKEEFSVIDLYMSIWFMPQDTSRYHLQYSRVKFSEDALKSYLYNKSDKLNDVIEGVRRIGILDKSLNIPNNIGVNAIHNAAKKSGYNRNHWATMALAFAEMMCV